MRFKFYQGSKKPQVSSFSTRPLRIGSLKLGWLRRGLPFAAASLLLGFGGGWLGARSYNNNQTPASSTTTKAQFISNESELIAGIASDAGSGVVSIDVERKVTNSNIFGFGGSQTQAAAGTGFIISSDGTIITNRHVIPSGTSSVSVTLADGTRFDNVRIIGRAASSSSLDIAFLKITNLKGKKVTPLKLGDSSKVKVGDRVIAIGNALGQFQNTVTSGIISGFGRDVTAGDGLGQSAEVLTNLFQTDAAINAGNSGGPLVNIAGEVIGVNTAVAGGADNIGFAIPINDVKNLISGVLKDGKVEQPFLGVRYITLTDDLANQFKLDTNSGAYILPSDDDGQSIVPGSPAAKAGLEAEDIITKVNGVKIDDKNSLSGALSRFKVGDTIILTILRGDQSLTITATLEAAPGD
ncbi:trypsin-like peptidase domain-containing protein [Candidatus Saccharibacteria bacterium]|nr:trypsin-like peptidase domain-containing protein [Candidatus Saccharibacteria bacterium]